VKERASVFTARTLALVVCGCLMVGMGWYMLSCVEAKEIKDGPTPGATVLSSLAAVNIALGFFLWLSCRLDWKIRRIEKRLQDMEKTGEDHGDTK
jgi:hypothetical protein